MKMSFRKKNYVIDKIGESTRSGVNKLRKITITYFLWDFM